MATYVNTEQAEAVGVGEGEVAELDAARRFPLAAGAFEDSAIPKKPTGSSS